MDAHHSLFDMHCHLDWFADAPGAAEEAARQDLLIFANTVTPEDFVHARDVLGAHDNVIVGVGAHPWWIADGRIDQAGVAQAAELAYGHPFVGEVGLDFSDAHTPAASHEAQVSALRRILRACDSGAHAGVGKLISLHAVRSAGIVLDLLETTGCLRSCTCVFHWFSGTSDELHRSVQAGCLFSVNEMMLHTRRGREYARQLPPNRLLTETDLPPDKDSACQAKDIVASLERTLGTLAALRAADVRGLVAQNAATLLERC